MSDYSSARKNMVESQIRPNEVTDARLIRALQTVPREAFVPARFKAMAYMEGEITIQQGGAKGERRLVAPMPLARLIQLAEVDTGDLVLDIGCATGYSTALLASMAESVVGLECDSGLAEQAGQTLTDLGIDNAAVVSGALPEGYPSEGPFDVILMNGSVPEVPDGLLTQLSDGGRLVVVIAEHEFGNAVVFRNSGGRISQRASFDAGAPILPGFEREASFVF